MTSKIVTITRKEYDLVAKNRGIKEPQNTSIEELLNTLSRYDSRRKVKNNRRKLSKINSTKEDLIFSPLKSESNPAERNYMEYFNNSTNNEIKRKINDIRLILSRSGNIVTKNDRKKIKKEVSEIEKRQNLSDNEKEKIYYHLVKLANTLHKKEERKHTDHDDLDYFGVRELENLFTSDDYNGDNYYKPLLIKSSF